MLGGGREYSKAGEKRACWSQAFLVCLGEEKGGESERGVCECVGVGRVVGERGEIHMNKAARAGAGASGVPSNYDPCSRRALVAGREEANLHVPKGVFVGSAGQRSRGGARACPFFHRAIKDKQSWQAHTCGAPFPLRRAQCSAEQSMREVAAHPTEISPDKQPKQPHHPCSVCVWMCGICM